MDARVILQAPVFMIEQIDRTEYIGSDQVTRRQVIDALDRLAAHKESDRQKAAQKRADRGTLKKFHQPHPQADSA